ncbi:hypothetical protein HOU03_gp169 [Caulobacter phage CcrSC]|uniref:Uncharacterized protein n=1 Tax=Caulobacter phage CcrSC TaxID=2283272 RepID=A0A385EFX0_9CAUD|nr:hypothetical protein HOU03_gp017 [Caulobacter phage CcrSC]YP_009810729.1 hypothetical protein HOU03_gp169 [Caulobacter phage CcrSC]AXQ69599.1 hypothetical protein CcrSC_gp017 [Caulobacter phage CcrSC]AXQ70099.1 hypothetical protein CcrSC_gp517 [Caulobacter phage CcrSC]
MTTTIPGAEHTMIGQAAYRSTKRPDQVREMAYGAFPAATSDSPFAVKPACGKVPSARVLEDFDPADVFTTRANDRGGFYASANFGGSEVSWISIAGYGDTEEAARADLMARFIADRDGKGKFGPHHPLVGYDWGYKLAPFWDMLEREAAIRQPFKRQLYLGKLKSGRPNPKGFDVFVDVEWTGVRLSLSGVIGPKANGNAWDGAGQIVGSLKRKDFLEFAPSWHYGSALDGLVQAWTRWHLNDLRAGTLRQEDHLRGYEAKRNIEQAKAAGAHSLDATRAELARVHMEPDTWERHNGRPYSYGSAWLREEVPTYVLDFLRNLPAPTKISPWR